MRTTFCSFTRCLTSKWLVLFAVALLAMAVTSVPASAQAPPPNNCVQDEFTAAGNSQTLVCTANDVRVAKVINTRNLAGQQITECQPGNFSFIADFLVQTTSSKTRSNIGLYFGTADVNTQPTALTGLCLDNIISPSHPCPGGSATCGSSSYIELDGNEPQPNTANAGCGDTSSNDATVCLNSSNQVVACTSNTVTQTFPSTQIVTVEIDNFPCTAPVGTNALVLPNCTSWQVPGKTLLCVTPAPDYPYNIAAIPGSPSKCNCDTIPLGITVQSPSVTVAKACTTASSPGTNTSCNLFPEGGTVTYTVTITNNSNFGDIIVDQICDNRYGNIFTGSGITPACAAGTIGTKDSTTCTSALLTIAQGASQSCTFTATQAEDVTVTDQVTVKGHGVSSGTFGPNTSNNVTVVSHEATTTGTIIKSLVTTTAACATVRYEVKVNNTSASGTDEILNLSALSDNTFGDITKFTGSSPTPNALVLGTTCGVATSSSGLGTLSAFAGAGALPVTLPVNGGEYKCRFDAQFCGALATIITTPGTCVASTCSVGKVGESCSTNPDCNVTCNGIQHTNIVSATLTGDEGVTDVVSLTPGTAIVSQCISGSQQ